MRCLVCILLFFGICSQSVAVEIHRLVLVSANQDFKPISTINVRRLFMGVPVVVDHQQVKPLINIAEEIAHEVFLQKVVFMSAQKYKRQLLSRVFRYGGKRPGFYSDSYALNKDLQSNPDTVSYMWARDAGKNSELFIIQELWRGSIE